MMQHLAIAFAIATILVVHFAYEGMAESCTQNNIRVDGGYGDYEGNVQICYNNTWGYVCSNNWDHNDAAVVCRQLGYSVTSAVYRINSYYGYGNGTIWLDYVKCKGNEKKLIDCPRTNDIGHITSSCWYGNVAGVFCPYGGTCTRGDIRLATFYPNSYGRSEGRVEVCYDNKWGTVCSDYWDYREVRVSCRQLGYGGNHYNYWLNYGAGGGSIWLSRLDCGGYESRLLDCRRYRSIGSTGCNHNQDVGIKCFDDETTSCVEGQYRLWSAYKSTPKSEGILQICYSGRWYSACDDSSCYLAKKACIALGYKGAIATRSNGGFYYGYYAYYDEYYYYCYTNPLRCYRHSSWWWYRRCTSQYRNMGVVCYDHDSKKDYCSSGDIRLIDGKSDNEGRVEYCYDGYWSPVCSLNSYTARLMCQKLGYKKYSWGKILSREEFGRSNKAYDFNYIYCSGSHTDLSKCQTYIKGGGGCFIQPKPCSIEYGLRCFEPGECDDGKVRLMNGTIEQEGRAEVCVNGIWSSICGYSWSQTDGYTICKELGYDGPNPNAYYYTNFGHSRGPVIWSSVYCGGWERSIFECTKVVYPKFTCHHNYEAGVTCKEWCNDGDVRLVDGNFDNEGTVEVCFDNLWGQISDSGWSAADAKVVCNELGHKNGIAKPISGSYYGSSDKIIHLKDVSCTGNEDNLAECTKTQLPFDIGKSAVENTDVAGVDCIFDIYSKPTEPPCIARDEANPTEACTSAGSFRLVNGSSKYEGRVEYCHNSYWTPLCSMDNRAAKVACKQLGLTQYSWGSILISGEYGNVMNYSTVDGVLCGGTETELSYCIAKTSASCLPWCPENNIGLKCFDSTECEEGSARIVDGVIEQEGRVEVCVNGVWGAICDKGWGKSDAHVLCQQLGLSESEPITFYNSHFGEGYYPIVYSNLKCGGWEDTLSDCAKEDYLDVNCTRNDLAGIFCGYDCKHGDVRLVGGSKDSEGTVETCLNNFWGLINEAGWSDNDAQVVCRELGYEVKGTIAQFGSHYGKPNKPVLVTDVLCDGEEESLRDCTQKEYSFYEGKQKLQKVEVAGVKCFEPETCVAPPEGGEDCEDGTVRLTGKNSKRDEGSLEYCYKGLWSKFCSLAEREAAVACKQLGFNTNVASVYVDGRYDSKSNSSLFLNFTCGDMDSIGKSNFSECILNDTCRSTCSKTIGIKCYASDGCSDGSVRLMSGGLANGRLEVCYSNVWGSICGKDFDHTDAYVVCKELGRGVSEPTVTTTSSYGDGGLPIVYGGVQCKGFEPKLQDCSKEGFGEFKCFHNNTVGIICQDNCNDGDIRLVGGKKGVEGSVEVCYDNLWGMVASVNWDNKDATVVCYQLGYVRTGSTAYTQSEFGKSDKTVHLSNVKCKGSEKSMQKCTKEKISLDEGEKLFKWIDVAGVSCNSTLRPTATLGPMTATANNSWTVPSTTKKSSSSSSLLPFASVVPILNHHIQQNGMTIGVSLFFVVLVIVAIAVVTGIIIFLRRKWLKMKGTSNDQVQLSNIYEEKSFDIYSENPIIDGPITAGDPTADEDPKKDVKEPPPTIAEEDYY